MRDNSTRIVSSALIIVLCLGPELLFGQSTRTSTPQPVSTQTNGQPDSGSTTSVPDAPQPQSAQDQSAATAKAAQNQNSEQQTNQPEGTAAARAAKTIGGPASKPAGSAIAPAKQSQRRSLLIKLGAIAGAGAALGTVYALTRGTPSKPPGAH
jgi:cobalamin biosynthesis Mg chelatase CobN